MQAKDSNNASVACGNASNYTMAPKSTVTGNPATGTSSSVFGRGDMLVWAFARPGGWRALLTGGAAQRALVGIVGPLKEGDAVPRFGIDEIRRGPA